MPTSLQLSLISRGPLFEEKVRKQFLLDKRNEPVPNEAAKIEALREWVDSLAALDKTKETSLEQAFNLVVLGQVLGYKLYPAPSASAWPKPPSAVTGMAKEPDVLLGAFKSADQIQPLAALELKTPGTKLDAPQQNRNPPLTPVQQAFGYAEGILGIRWVLVSDMASIRLYSVESAHESMSFDLRSCVSGSESLHSFRELYWFLSHESLIKGGSDSNVSNLLGKSLSRQIEIRDSFYEVFFDVRADLLQAVEASATQLDLGLSRSEVLQSTQKLLDRMLFLYYCEDNPERLIPASTVEDVTKAARRLPGPGLHKVYDALKGLFREVDSGSPHGSLIELPAYNGELFKPDPVIDEIDLPDSLHDRIYRFEVGGEKKEVQGVWGLYAFDFWKELNEHLLGHIFEQSLSDMEALASNRLTSKGKLGERKKNGVYYTPEVLADYLAGSAIRSILLDETASTIDGETSDISEQLEARAERLGDLRVIDLCCGSGAFLVSTYQAVLEEFWASQEALDSLKGPQRDLLTLGESLTQAKLLRNDLYGVDLLPQAVEIAKLALWLRSARKDQRVANLSKNLVAGDSLDTLNVLNKMGQGLGEFDLVVGNPPWGAELDPSRRAAICGLLGLDPGRQWDSWEIFVALGLKLLRPGGRLALVLPDTFFSPNKAAIRRIVLESGPIEYLHNLGIDWFADVRMGTMLLQVKVGELPPDHVFDSLLLTGAQRKLAIAGDVPLSQIAHRYSRPVPQQRCLESENSEIEIFRSPEDDRIMGAIQKRSVTLRQLCERGRGEEINKAGQLWICPVCQTANVPGRKRKRAKGDADGARYQEKECKGCHATINEFNVQIRSIIDAIPEAGPNIQSAPYIDGDDINRRYRTRKPSKQIHLDFQGFPFKPESDYAQTKLLIRQAGVGLMATVDNTGARCPQSVYWYRLTDEAAKTGYSHEFILATLLSRTMAYFVFKRFAEVDPDRPHAKLTHDRLADLPIPKVDFSSADQKAAHEWITEKVRDILGGTEDPGKNADMEIDVKLRDLWGLEPDDGVYVTQELVDLPESQVIRELFPEGVPRSVLNASAALEQSRSSMS